MKQFLTLFFIITSYLSFGQIDSVTDLVEKTLSRYYHFPNEVHDSCYYSNTLLKIELDKNSNIASLKFSDNAKQWLVAGLPDFEMRLDKEKIKIFLKKDKIKNSNIIIPLIIKSGLGTCHSHEGFYWFSNKYYLFNSKRLEGNFIFLNPVELTFFDLIN